jgi:hypothetical protein
MRALSNGHLRPLLDYALADPEVRFDIRPGGANLYYDGGSLLRLEGGTRSPFRGIYSKGYVGEKGEDERELTELPSTLSLIASFRERREQMWQHRHSGKGRDERRNQQAIARANSGRPRATVGDFVIVDTEYDNGRRIFDLVGFDCACLPRPKLIFIELKCEGGALNGKSGLQDHAIDYGDFLCAQDGRHVGLSQRELSNMVKQKVDLGLLSADLGFEEFATEPPEFLILFADYDVCRAQLTTPLTRMRAEIEQRLGGLELLRFADLPVVDDGSTERLRLRRDQIMDSQAFDTYRERTH